MLGLGAGFTWGKGGQTGMRGTVGTQLGHSRDDVKERRGIYETGWMEGGVGS